MSKKLLIIDGHALIHRAYHALPPLRTKKGIPTNAIYGFFSMLHIAIATMKPDHLIVAFDTPAPTFRKKLLSTYQASRPELEEDLVIQFNLIKELLDAANIARAEMPGFEADDVIGTLATRFSEKGLETIVLTGDKDILQLVNGHIHIVMPKVGLTQTIEYTPKSVKEKMLVGPKQIPDMKALSGDPSDNYKGIAGLGPKTALKILTQFPTIEELYENIDKLQDEKLRGKLIENEELVKLLKTIATIRKDVPVQMKLEESKLDPLTDKLKETMKKYEFNSLLKRYFPEEAKAEEKKKIKPDTEKKDPSQMDLF